MEAGLFLQVILATFLAHAYSTCPDHASCMTSKGNGVCRNDTCVVIPAGVRNDLQFTVIVKYPEEKLQVNIN